MPLNINDDSHPLVIKSIAFDSMRIEAEKANPVSLRVFEVGDGELSPVHEFNKAYALREYMLQLGFKFKSKNRAIHPNSNSGSAGIFIFPEGDRAFSHHGCDVLLGKSFDAFDLFVQFEHGGNFKAGVKAAGDMLKTPEGLTINEHNRKLFSQNEAYLALPELDWDTFLGKKKPRYGDGQKSSKV